MSRRVLMKIGQKFIFFLAIVLGVFIFGIGKVHATAPILSPSSGVAGSAYTIYDDTFEANQLVTATWDSTVLDKSNASAGIYSFSAHVPTDASVGAHLVTVTGENAVLMYNGQKNNWASLFIARALAADGSSTFTVTAPPVTPPAETPVADTNTAPANTNTKNIAPSPANSNQATAEPVAPTNSTVTPEPTAQTKSTNEVKKGVKMCYFPWWIWLLLALITVTNLALFLSRFWKKKSKQLE